ncbi:bifunctional pyr operon transcriptional regulator/uracil phosphoribosyltransferase PyrR [Paeniglutamicibacter terrestris]|jgi:pyrimidine operon attenuation protein/uracil phosphoribosyltransferase|uniref:Bifunctional protein PyrR n=1 Tax=Paeniglutamicibacter terrestris TaxID=2723403 RepID=A0ABX1G548_9MICC|nr:bifunctional pyr operon transcriptional regulator/uracil phosphoribosyltransferase PyrR [Paeniglutamicibacter terrestris]ASN39274.1 bifunctional pyr operon transcriptional regulator/uracil phosphoribosyltransferase [Arthrobacter sp. 7749]NKG20851.1 bifunctional pyr operon transcriptional regulator/uracil phosphoribosyltransferase PyrR [Paeniglutamicibacter terrestris]
MSNEPENARALAPVSARIVLSSDDIDRVITRIAHEIIEANKGTADLVLLGIPSRGFPLAQRLAQRIAATDPTLDPSAIIGQLDVTMYRDDLRHSTTRTPVPTRLPATGIDGKVVVLVDDVLYSGRTIRAALDAIADLGRPRIVRLAVLVDRGHRELPIRADHVGKNLPTATTEKVRVHLSEVDGENNNEVIIEATA